MGAAHKRLCPHERCNAQVRRGAQYCARCGRSLVVEPEPSAAEPEPRATVDVAAFAAAADDGPSVKTRVISALIVLVFLATVLCAVARLDLVASIFVGVLLLLLPALPVILRPNGNE